MLNISNSGLKLIKHFEQCRLEVYADTNGFPTVGWGHLVLVNDKLKLGDKITQEKADQLFKSDLLMTQKKISPAFETLPQNKIDTLTSLAFNLTTESFNTLQRYLKSSEELFKDKMLLYCKDSSGHTLRGLKRRRICERLQFENKEWYEIDKKLQAMSIEEMDANKIDLQKYFADIEARGLENIV